MNKRLSLLISAAIGAAAMYYFDPARGRYRRSLMRNQLAHAGRTADHGLRVAARDIRNRAVGTAAELRSVVDSSRPDDDVLAQRVRACLGRCVTHPSSIDVRADNGVITLSGPILEDEVQGLIDCARGVSGVKDVRNELEKHAEAGNIPGLQGTPRRRPGARSAFARENWSPAARVAAGAAGAIATASGLRRHGTAGTLLGAAGLLLFGRALTNIEARRLFGLGKPRHTVDIRKRIRIEAPVDDVFRAWDNFENFPHFMTHVRRIQRLATADGRGRWRWTVRGGRGIGGLEIEFDSVLTAREENRLLAWRTEGRAPVRHAGHVLFRANDDGSTTATVKIAYNPIAGALGHAIACLLGADPKRQMDDDLLRMKSFLETGRMPHDAADPTDDEWVHRAPGDAHEPSERSISNTSGEHVAPVRSDLH